MESKERGGFGTFLRLLILVVLLVVGYQMWTARLGNNPPITGGTSSGSPAPAVPPSPVGAPPIPTVQSTVPQGGQVRLAEPREISASVYAGMLKTIHELMTQGNEVEAEAKLAALPPKAFGDQRIRHYTALLWNNLGVIKSQARGAAAGVSAFKSARSLDPENPTAHVNLVHAYWELKDPALTLEFLERTIALAPNDALPHLALADMLYNKDDLAGAVLHLDHATQRATQNPELHSYLELVTAKVKQAAKAEQKFSSRVSSHFTVKFDGNEDYDVWHRVLDILEDAYRDIGQKIGYYPSKPITVVLYTKAAFPSATGSPAWADGLFDPMLGRIQIPTQGALTNQSWLSRVLRHEFVHALLHERVGGELGMVPTWLNEGLAMQLAGDPWPDIDQLVTGEVTLIPLTRLEGNWLGLPASAATVAYLEGNAATLYLIDRFGMEKVREILSQLANKQPIAAAIQDRLFISYDEFQRRWVDSLNEKMKIGRS